MNGGSSPSGPRHPGIGGRVDDGVDHAAVRGHRKAAPGARPAGRPGRAAVAGWLLHRARPRRRRRRAARSTGCCGPPATVVIVVPETASSSDRGPVAGQVEVGQFAGDRVEHAEVELAEAVQHREPAVAQQLERPPAELPERPGEFLVERVQRPRRGAGGGGHLVEVPPAGGVGDHVERRVVAPERGEHRLFRPAHDERRVRDVHGCTDTAHQTRARPRSSVPSHGMFGWFQLIHASFVPSGDGVGNAKNCAPETSTLMASAEDAADPSSGTATMSRRTATPPPRWKPSGTASPSTRQHRLPHAPDLLAVGGQDQVGEAEPAVGGRQRHRLDARLAPRRPPRTAAGRRSSRRRGRSRPPATATGRAGTTCRRTRAPGSGRSTGREAAPSARRTPRPTPRSPSGRPRPAAVPATTPRRRRWTGT